MYAGLLWCDCVILVFIADLQGMSVASSSIMAMSMLASSIAPAGSRWER